MPKTFAVSSSSTGGGTPAAPDTSVQFNDAGSFGSDPGFTYDKTLNALSVPEILAVGPGTDPTDLNAFGSIQLISARTISGDPGYVIGQYTNADLSTGSANPTSLLNPIITEADCTVAHDLEGIIGHDHTLRIIMANGATISGETFHSDTDLFVTGNGTIGDIFCNVGTRDLQGAAISNLYDLFVERPSISAGATLGNFYGLAGDDLAALTVSGVKHFINYAVGKFIVDYLGIVQPSGYKSSDGTSGVSGTDSVGNIFKDGLNTTVGSGASGATKSFAFFMGS